MNELETLKQQVSWWAGVSVHPHRFGGWEFRFGSAEIGHIHTGGILDIPFPRSVRNALLDEGLAEEHHWVPNSGWTTYRIGSQNDLRHAFWLMRLSYLRYALKTAADAGGMFEEETEQPGLSARFKSLLEPFIRKYPKEPSIQTVPA